MKLTLKDKINIINQKKLGKTNIEIALEHNVNKSTIKKLIAKYRLHGETIFKGKGKNIKYTLEYKLEIVNRVLNGESKTSIETKTGINTGQIYSWCKKYEQLGYNGLKTDLRGVHMKTKRNVIQSTDNLTKDEEIKLLREKNEQLEMELDLIKKLNALVQQRKEQQNKKK